MISYELAKQLKDAGFPLELASLADQKHHEPMFTYGLDFIGRSATYLYPTLSELIEACGEDFYSLIKLTDSWRVEYFENFQSYVGPIVEKFDLEGSTPEEAVANLWLELNSDKKS